jgi:hypothetical protein
VSKSLLSLSVEEDEATFMNPYSFLDAEELPAAHQAADERLHGLLPLRAAEGAGRAAGHPEQHTAVQRAGQVSPSSRGKQRILRQSYNKSGHVVFIESHQRKQNKIPCGRQG